MALNWNWNSKMGELTIKLIGKEYRLNIYDGNCLGIILTEWKDEQGKDMYQLYTFFADCEHLYRCLGLRKGYNSIFAEGEFVSMRLDMRYKNSETIAKAFVKAGYEVTLYESKE